MPKFLYNFSLRIIGRNPKPIWFKGSKKLKAVKRKKFNISFKERSLIEQLKSTLLSDLNLLLRHEDRNSMRWSIESRVPFLTKDLADFCLSLPENFLLSDHGQTKYILRESMKSIV